MFNSTNGELNSSPNRPHPIIFLFYYYAPKMQSVILRINECMLCYVTLCYNEELTRP